MLNNIAADFSLYPSQRYVLSDPCRSLDIRIRYGICIANKTFMKHPDKNRWIDVLKITGLALLYALLAKVSMQWFSIDGIVSFAYFPSGLSLAVLLLAGRKYWPGIFLGDVIGNLAAGTPTMLSFAFAFGETSEALLGFWLLTRFTHFDNKLPTPRSILLLLVTGAVTASFAALFGTTLLFANNLITPPQTFAGSLWAWWQGDYLGIFLLTPLILVWRKVPQNWFSAKRLPEAISCFGLTLLMGQILFFDWFKWLPFLGLIQDHLMFMFIIWSALSFGRRGVLLVITIIGTQGLLGAVNGKGIFAVDFFHEKLTGYWIFMLLSILIGLSLAQIIRERRKGEEELKQAQRIALMGNWSVDLSTNQLTWSDEIYQIFGYDKSLPPPDFKQHSNLFTAESWDKINHSLLSARESGIPYEQELEIIRKNGDHGWVWARGEPIVSAPGSVTRLRGVVQDITEKKKSEDLIWQQANFDHLTGLANRRRFYDRLNQEITKGNRAGYNIGLMYLDIDLFKEINDTLGHDTGDLLLQQVASRLQECIRESDFIARLGGDEFAVILSPIEDIANIERVATSILLKLAEPFKLHNVELHNVESHSVELHSEVVYISASMGITLYPDDASDLETLLKNADQAMYTAKYAGRNRYQFFTESMQKSAKQRMRISNDMHGALAANQYRIYYQPIIELATGSIHKAEALIRWQHPKLGVLCPADFIPVAEENGLILEIGDWMLRESALQAVRWRLIDPAFQISVNKSPVQFNERKKHADWFVQLKDLGLPGQCLSVEITEGLLANDKINEKLLQFRDAGIEVALDDFGTGYSSLSYLKKFHIDYLKIDQTFIKHLSPDSNDMALCEAIIVMAHKLNIRVIAEGIETEQQRELLTRGGCDFGQGFLFSKPLLAAEFEQLLKKVNNH